jgi:tetratricopeptide (TPR) repeat protein
VNAPLDPLARNAPLRALTVGAVLAAAAVMAYFNITDLDIGGHLAVGREILKSRSIPDTDFLTHTVRGHPYPIHQWLGQVILFATDHLFGVTGLILLRMAVVVLAGVLLYRNARREEAPVAVSAAIVLLLLLAVRPRMFIRPMLASLVFLPWLQAIVGDVRRGKTRRLWPILPILTVWGHIHSGVLFGILFLAGTLVAEGVKLLVARRRKPGAEGFPGEALDGWNYRRLAIFAAIGSALPFATMALVNPSGVKPLVLPLLFFRNDAFRAMILEYRPVDLAVDWPFDMVAGAVLLGILLRPRRVDLADLVVVAGFGVLAFQSVRAIVELSATAAPLLARTWGSLAEDGFTAISRGRSRRKASAGLANSAEAGLLLAVIGGAFVVSLRCANGWMYPFGIGKDPKHYPERALDFVDAQGVRGNVFNTDIWSGSILWRWHGVGHPVFVDARLEAYPEEFWRDEYYRVLQAAPGWQDVLERRKVQWAILRREGKQTDDRIGEVLWEDPGWGLVYWDDYVMIFLRRGGPSSRNDDILATWEFTSFHPRRSQAVRDLRGEALVLAANELADLVAWTPDSFLPRWALAAAWTRLGQGEEAAAIFEQLAALREAKKNAPFTRSHAEAELVAGRRASWESLVRTLGDDPASAGELFGAAALLRQAGRTGEAVQFYREVLRADPDHLDARNNLALLLARDSAGREEARALIEEVVRRRPDDGYFLASRGEIRWRAGDAPGALEDFRRALALVPATDAPARAEIEAWIARIP